MENYPVVLSLPSGNYQVSIICNGIVLETFKARSEQDIYRKAHTMSVRLRDLEKCGVIKGANDPYKVYRDATAEIARIERL